MVDAYIAFDRYDRGEDFTVYNITRNREEALKNYIERDLTNAIMYRFDSDGYFFRLQKVSMTKKDFKWLTKRLEHTPSDFRERMSLRTMLENIYQGDGYETEIIFHTECREEYFNILNETIVEPDIFNFPSAEEYDIAHKEYEEKCEKFLHDRDFAREIVENRIKQKYANETTSE